MAGKLTTTEQGYGWQHQKQTASLKRAHRDGTPCWWCGEPMYGDNLAHLNTDGRKLQGDHSIPVARGGTKTDRLLHARCNTERGDGGMDDVRPAITRQQAAQRGGHAGNVLEWGS